MGKSQQHSALNESVVRLVNVTCDETKQKHAKPVRFEASFGVVLVLEHRQAHDSKTPKRFFKQVAKSPVSGTCASGNGGSLGIQVAPAAVQLECYLRHLSLECKAIVVLK